ncbi:glycosyl transferase family 2 [Antricoccus suffuscus]|uniref:Glycosyl transferase family 2 n=1 Tax=Antricoccus suffuscus TaxID=1629062 RepID=A0A2T1A1M1_9ACTN|nr:glycosyltransferase family A protein [Antricoccus suffuscus]PRZ42496.1 glycosyl transferase family 2 [Antricoccus suffuscus]
MSASTWNLTEMNGISKRLRISPKPPVAGDVPAFVSVVIPCYNYDRFLPDAVNSALTQTGVSVEVIIVDDASTDGSLSIARALERREQRVKVFSNEQNSGPVMTFNRGLQAATGEFLVRLDADDLLTPGSLKRSVAVARAFPSVGLVYGHPVHFSGDVPRTASTKVSTWTVWPGREWLSARCASGVNVITSPEVLMRASVVDHVGGQQQQLAHTHDMEMWFRIAAFADIAHVEGVDQAWHREHGASLSERADTMMILEERLAAFDVLFSGVAAGVAGSAAMHRSARQELAAEALRRTCRALDRGRITDGEMDEYIAFARRASSDVEGTRAWGKLERRRAKPPSKYHPFSVGRGIMRRIVDRRRYRHWTKWGVYRD